MNLLLQNVVFLLIIADSSSPDASECSAILAQIAANGGTHVVAKASESQNLIEKHRVAHILTETCDFAAANEARDLLVPVTTVQWLTDSVRENQRKNYRLYLPEPQPPMSKIVLCVANNLALGDKDMMYTAARLFGGQYLDQLSRYTTHLVAVDRVNSKAVIAANLKLKRNMDVKIVLPAWFAECIKQQRCVPEEPYLLSDRVVCETGLPNKAKVSEDSEDEENAELRSHRSSNDGVLAGKVVFISPDFNLSKPLIDSLESLIASNGGTVAPKFSENHVDVYLCRYRSGDHYKRAVTAPNMHIGLIMWMFHVIATGCYVNPLESNLLFFPAPKGRVHKFQNMRISITGINGDARHYLTLLITAMGAGFTKTLDRTNDVLVCGVSVSDKIVAAKARWPNIRVVNYLWVEDCYAQWKFLDPKNPKYTSLEDNEFLGRARLSKQSISDWLDYSSDVLGIGDTDESEAEVDVPTEELKTQEPNEGVAEKLAEASASGSVSGSHEAQFEDASDQIESGKYDAKEDAEVEDAEVEEAEVGKAEIEEVEETEKPEEVQESEEPEEVQEVEEPEEEQAEQIGVDTEAAEKPTDSEDPVIIKETVAPVSERASRSAKQKASLKLHSDMEDLNKYLSISKSSKKMKDYMALLELSVTKTPTKRKDTDAAEPAGSQGHLLSTPAKKKQKPDSSARYVAIMTGCELNITLSRVDLGRLSRVGITIVNDYNASKRTIDTIVAPKVLRTEKFLKSLSRAERIIHPDYLTNVLAVMNEGLSQDDAIHDKVNIDDYSLEKVLSVDQVNEELGYEGSGNGLSKLLSMPNRQIFSGLRLNFSKNLNGGAELIQSILEAHGLADSLILKVSAGTEKDDLISSENGDTILVAHKQKDQKFKARGVIVVDWNWCVKCLFTGHILPFK